MTGFDKLKVCRIQFKLGHPTIRGSLLSGFITGYKITDINFGGALLSGVITIGTLR